MSILRKRNMNLTNRSLKCYCIWWKITIIFKCVRNSLHAFFCFRSKNMKTSYDEVSSPKNGNVSFCDRIVSLSSLSLNYWLISRHVDKVSGIRRLLHNSVGGISWSEKCLGNMSVAAGIRLMTHITLIA